MAHSVTAGGKFKNGVELLSMGGIELPNHEATSTIAVG
jgi:hypothetical protein